MNDQYAYDQPQPSSDVQNQQPMDVGHKAYMPRFSTRIYAKPEDVGAQNYEMNENNLDSLPFYGNSDRYQS